MKKFLAGIREAYKSIWTKERKRSLPPRALAMIERNDDMSEVLVKLIQLIVTLGIGLLYFLAPVPNPDTVSMVPMVLAFYLLFTLVALGFAVARALPNWLIYLSIVFDVALLTYLIWSFHIQYDQPASFSLKSPSFMVYFVLIGLRALRFDARYVVMAGVASIISWSLLVAYVVFNDPADPMITRDYITYLTSNTVLIGAEVDKLVVMALFTVILAIAVKRAHTFLVTSIAEGNAANDLARFMPNSVAEQIRDSDHEIKAGEGSRRSAAILNVDIRGFTELVREMEPMQAMAILSDYQHQVVPIVHRHNGVVDKFMGDGILVTFGASEPDPAYCANALRCALEIVAQRDNWQGAAKDLRLNVAVASGDVIYGPVGDGDRLEYTVIGPAVNASAKLEKHNKALGTTALCYHGTYLEALDQGFEALPVVRHEDVRVEGFQAEADIVVLR